MPVAYQYTACGWFAGKVEDYGLLPNNATRTPPPVLEGKIPRWDGVKWDQVEDHKGKTGYVNGQPCTINEYGPLPDGWSDTPSLADAQTNKRQQINAGFDAAMTASLTMPSSSTPPLAFEVAYAIYDWRTEDPDGYAALLAIHTARRDALLAAVAAATSVEAVQAIAVSFAV